MKIGKHSYIAYNQINILFPEMGELTIGKYCSIAENVVIFLGGEHNIGNISTFPFDKRLDGQKSTRPTHLTKGDVNIGNDVWIGRNAVIMSGITIGDGAVVGAYSVVTKNIGPYQIWAGNPAVFVKARFGKDFKLNKLMLMKWWNWPEHLIIQAIPLLTSDNIDGLVEFWNEKVRYII